MDFGDLLVTIIVIASSFFKGNFFFTFPEIIYLLIYLLVAVLGLCCYEGSSLVVAQTSYCSGFSYCRAWALGHEASSCGPWAQ